MFDKIEKFRISFVLKKSFIILLFTLFTSFALFSVGIVTNIDIQTDVDDIFIGMSKDDVVTKLGEPSKISIYTHESDTDWDLIEFVCDIGIYFQFYRCYEFVTVIAIENPKYYISIDLILSLFIKLQNKTLKNCLEKVALF